MKKLYALLRSAALITLLISANSSTAQYCTTNLYTYGCTDDDYIESFRTTGGATNITNYNTFCTSGLSGYTYYSAQTHTGSAGSAVNFRLINGDFYDEDYFLFVDWNADNDFTDAGEMVATGSVLQGDSVISSFNIPASTISGTKRMRVRVVYDPQTTVSACSQEDYGEVEDYNLVVTGGASPCNPPAASTISNITATTADVSWTPVSGAISYDWVVNTSSTPPASGMPTGGTTATAGPLSPSTTYYLHVRAQCGATNFSTWLSNSFTTLAPPPCPAPDSIRLDSVTSNFAKISWPAATGAGGYEFAINNNSTPPASGTATTQLSASIPSLAKGTKYYAHVRSVCSTTFFSPWKTKEFYTQFAASVTGAQNQALTIYPNPASDIIVIESGHAINKAFVRITDISGRTILQQEANTAHTRIDVSKLQPGVYILKYSEGESVSIHRIVKQ